MSRIEEFFEKSVDSGIIPQMPMNYDAVAYKIYTGYLENKIDELTAENADLREKLAEAEYRENVMSRRWLWRLKIIIVKAVRARNVTGVFEARRNAETPSLCIL